ncbi:MAG: glycerol-3-phosphate dehydrogenase [Magnetovibrio sp.]|nr:glycerol-3-phosphate dehydrogenase [Magnetovibrio sp.]
MREGSLDAPVRHPIAWQSPDFIDEEKLDQELRRVFDICHGCRRCFNLCDSFPRLFDLIDDSKSGELDTVASKDFAPIVEACTLCDMCFLTKCPYVPPHEFNIDFPHLMVRFRAAQLKKGEISRVTRRLTETDKNGKLGGNFSSLANWASKRSNVVTRSLMENTIRIHRDAALPKFEKKRFSRNSYEPSINQKAPAYGRKAIIFSTCFVEYNNTDIGLATRSVLAKNGVETTTAYPSCCGMPQLEHGDFERVAAHAIKTATELMPWVEKGYDVIAPIPSCALMLKFEWPLVVPENELVKKLAKATFDVSEYMADINKKEGLTDGLKPLGKVLIHVACHSRAQNMGQKGVEILRSIPDTEIRVIERCSGHGGSWGVMKDNFGTALKVGKPVARQAATALDDGIEHIVSECPLAREHILQGTEGLATLDASNISSVQHPIQLLARAYGLESNEALE